MSRVLSSELSHFIVDNENGQHDDSLHQAAWRGDVEELRRLLTEDVTNIDKQLRPFYATPLRLAAGNHHADCVALLLEHGSSVDIVDRKGQTPLFCAVKNWDTESCITLLQAGASPDGDPQNLSTPLHIACQDGYALGVKLLMDFGAQTEWAYATPQWTHPLHVAATYQHLACFIILLEGGADVTLAGHILHVICTKKNSSVFAINLQAENQEACGPQSPGPDVYTRCPSTAEKLPHVQRHPRSETMYNDHEYRTE